MSFVNRKLYKQKPQAWGPVSSVHASIFKNAERVGIDPGIFTVVSPFWEKAGDTVYNYINIGQSGAITNATWEAQGVLFDAAGDRLRFPPVLSQSEGFLFIENVRFEVRKQYSTWLNIETLSNNSPHEMILQCNNSDYLTFKPNADQSSGDLWNYGIYTDVMPLNELSFISASWKNTVGIAGYVNGKVTGSESGDSNWTAADWTASELIGLGNTPDNSNTEAYSRSHIGLFICGNSALSADKHALIADNPYFLLHRAPPVFYSVPGGGIIIKNITDSCIGTDSIAQISNFFSVSDAGTGADGFAGLTAGLSVVDAGSVVDTVKPIAALTVQDTGSAIDLIQQISAACSVADTGTGTDSIGQLLASLVVSDAGAGADVITVLKGLLKTVTDSGTGTDSISRILASLSVADTGSITDTISQILAGVSVSDTGTGVDFIALLKDILKTISDTGSGSDSVSIQPVSVSVQDAGTALDIIGHIVVALSVSDAGTIAEIISTIKTKMVTVTDTGTGSDSAPTISVSLTVLDTAAALDLVGQVINSLTVSDTGTGLESITKTNFDLLPNGKVTVTFTIKTPCASFAMRTQKTTLNIE